MKTYFDFLNEHVRAKDIKLRWYIKKSFKNIGDSVTINDLVKEVRNISTYKNINKRLVEKVLDKLIDENLVELSGKRYYWNWNSPKNLHLKNVFNKINDLDEEKLVSQSDIRVFYIHKALTQHTNKVNIEDLWADVKTGPGYHLLRDMQRKDFNDIVKKLVDKNIIKKTVKKRVAYYMWKPNIPKRSFFDKFLRGIEGI